MLARLSRLAFLYGRLQLLHLRTQLEYETDFWLGIAGVVLRHMAGFIFIWAVFHQVPRVQGWTLWEMVFLYALSVIPLGLVELFYDGPWRLGELVNEGDLDRLLLRPLPTSLQVVTQMSSLHGLGSVVLGCVLLVRAVSELHLSLSVWQYAFLGACLLGAMLLIGSLNFMTQCLVFWEPATTMSVATLVQEMTALARFPLTLYDQTLRFLITWVVPFAFVSYFPGILLLGRPEADRVLGYGAPLMGLVVTGLAGLVWRFCLKRYQGTGH
jgi:ABC-2 type transport system permease protein